MIPLNYHHLYYFYVIARAGSIAKARKTLMVSQPALSAQLKQLEASLGVTLFERRNQRLHLTEEGRMALEHAESIFETGRALRANLEGRPQPAPAAVRVGLLSGTARAFGHALVDSILKRFPHAHVRIVEGEMEKLLRELRDQNLDMLLSSQSVYGHRQGEFINHRVGRVPVVLAAAPALARRVKRLPQGLAGLPFILPSKPGHLYQQVLDRLAEWNVVPEALVEVQDAELARQLALSGHGVAPLNAYTAASGSEGAGLKVLGGRRGTGIYESVYVITRGRRWPNPVVEYVTGKFRLPKR